MPPVDQTLLRDEPKRGEDTNLDCGVCLPDGGPHSQALELPGTLHRTLQLLSVHPFEKEPMHELLTETDFRHLEALVFNYWMLLDL
jgi:hypothetical protein